MKRDDWRMLKKGEAGPACPDCGTGDPLPILYGLPAPALIRQAERGEVALGGCCIGTHDPKWQCRSCGLRYRDPGELPPHVKEAIWTYEIREQKFHNANELREITFRRFQAADPKDPEYPELLLEQGTALRLWIEGARALEAATYEMNVKFADLAHLPEDHPMRLSEG